MDSLSWPRESTTFWPLWWCVLFSIRVQTTLNHIRFVNFHTNLLNFLKIQTIIKSHPLMPGASNLHALLVYMILSYSIGAFYWSTTKQRCRRHRNCLVFQTVFSWSGKKCWKSGLSRRLYPFTSFGVVGIKGHHLTCDPVILTIFYLQVYMYRL